MSNIISLKDWINQEPLEGEVGTLDNGALYIPIDFIKAKLDYLCPSGWDTINFKHYPFLSPDGRWMFSGNVELCIDYTIDEQVISRTITGSATFDTERYNTGADKNENFGETCLSHCIVSAAKNIGRFFGKYLNKMEMEVHAPSGEKIISTLGSITKKLQ